MKRLFRTKFAQPVLALFTAFSALSASGSGDESFWPDGVEPICTEDGVCYFPGQDLNTIALTSGEERTVADDVLFDSGEAVPEELAELLKISLDDFRVVRTLEGYADKENFLAFVHGQSPKKNILDRALSGGNAVWIFVVLLFGGFLLKLTPCVLPLVPVNLALLGAGSRRSGKARGALLGASFGAGMAVAFGVLGLLAALTGRMIGFLQRSPVFHAAAAIVFCILAFAMLDVFSIDLSRFRKRRKPSEGSGSAVASFFAGAGSSLLSGACVAPVLASALLLAADLVGRGHPVIGCAIPFVLGLGMALPWPFLGAGVAALPKPGAWMRRVKHLFALVFVIAAIVYLARAWRTAFPEASLPKETSLSRGQTPVWFNHTQGVLWAYELDKRPILLELTADWCAACHAMQKEVISDPDVQKELAEKTFCLRIDCTASSPETQAIIQKVGARGLPFHAILEVVK